MDDLKEFFSGMCIPLVVAVLCVGFAVLGYSLGACLDRLGVL
jgi:hypothetical protein